MYLYAVKKPDEDLWLIFNGRLAGQWTRDFTPEIKHPSVRMKTGKVCNTFTWHREFAIAKAAEVGGEVDAFQLARLHGDDFREAMGEFDRT